ncbi:type VI secretion system ATPase TssH [Ideonella livida]|uniref:Type VI secretion system ATPase TssH n=1 Tax=Ideonella livida TaxID=2707176 RepID=A0A7C9TML1_9BURK|nr:type VI secretion system ATPase TssH [Ideonella livida]NDY94058.1 type VI secretion system ATPase TssH [Ideonella livida]
MDIDIRTLLGRLNPACKAAMTQAAEACVARTHFQVDLEHLLVCLLQPPAPDLAAILPRFQVDPQAVLQQLQQALDSFKRGNGRMPALSPDLGPCFQEAWLISAMLLGEQQVRSGTLLLALLEVDRLRGRLIDSAPSLLNIPRAALREQLPDLLAHSAEDAGGQRAQPAAGAPAVQAGSQPGGHPLGALGGGAGPQVSAPGALPGVMPSLAPHQDACSSPALDQFTTDLTRLAREGRIDPVQGRDAEIRQIIDILLRRRQNNPILTGEAGVGKTAVVEGFAQRVVAGDVPPALRQVSVRALDLGLLQAGAGVKGEFEHRLKQVMAEVRAAAQPVILFIDEAHQLIGAGGSEGQGDAANLLKPALARGELRTIAATTWAEYKKYVERDPALARRFQVIQVAEPEPEVAMGMLRGMVATLQAHHGVEVLDEAVREAVRLSHRHISGRQLPDKAISVLDTACARVAVAQAANPAALDDLSRRLQAQQDRREALRRALALGEPGATPEALAALEAEGARLGQQRQALQAKLAAERAAVGEILALRRRLAARAAPAPAREDSPPAAAGDADDDHGLDTPATLQRLMKGLEVLREDEPLVPLWVDAAAVAEVISGWTGVPVGRMLADELHTVLHLKDRLAERVVGQDAALDTIARRIRTFRAGLDDAGKPVGVFLLVGPSGVGKTETACALAELLYGGERHLITVNLSEFQEPHSVASLKGAPPGYVGYGRGGVLTEAVRRRPHSVVLLDEMEKAHPDVLELFFQVFDKGHMEDGEGVAVDFRNTVILLTSNAAQHLITDACTHGRRPPPELLTELLRPALQQQFSPAFLGRLVLVPYYPLGDVQIRRITLLKLRRLAERLQAHHHASLGWDEAVVAQLSQHGLHTDAGARAVDDLLTHHILPELSRQVLERLAMEQPFRHVQLSLGAAGQFQIRLGLHAPVSAGPLPPPHPHLHPHTPPPAGPGRH